MSKRSASNFQMVKTRHNEKSLPMYLPLGAAAHVTAELISVMNMAIDSSSSFQSS